MRDFERGRCDPPTFAAGLVADWALTVEPEESLASFAKWPIGLYDGAVQTVTELRETGVAAGCLSNTNQLHFDEQTSWGLFHLFDYPFLSHQLGMSKPDREIFEHVLDTLDRRNEPSSVLFVDDNHQTSTPPEPRDSALRPSPASPAHAAPSSPTDSSEPPEFEVRLWRRC